MRKLVVLLLVLLAVGAGAAVVWWGMPMGPALAEVEHLRAPRIVTMPAQKVLQVTASGDPNVAGKEAFSLLMGTYYRIPGVSRGGADRAAPRARWPKGEDVPAEQWVGRYAMPVPDAVESVPDVEVPDGLALDLVEWRYGEVAEILHVGSYDSEASTVDALLEFVADSGYVVDGEHEEEYLKGPGMLFAGDPAEYLTVIRYPVRPRLP